MIQPSFPAMFALTEELAIGFDEKFTSNIIPFIFFSKTPEFIFELPNYFYQEILF